MNYEREISQELLNGLKGKEIIIVTGMRRVGKTTLLRMAFETIESANKVFLDLENPIEQRIFDELDYNNIWLNLKSYGITKENKAYIFLDEIQQVPEIAKPLKYLHDHYDVKFVVTGSSSYYLKNLFPESLAGRKNIMKLSPLSFHEFLLFRGIQRPIQNDLSVLETSKNAVTFERYYKMFDEFLYYGGFPQVVLAENIAQKKSMLNDIFTSYFEKDVKVLADFRNMAAFRDTLLLLLQRVGSKLDVTRLASEVGVSRETIYSYISFLEATYVMFTITPYTKNRDREISGTRKVYCCDNGFLNTFAQISGGSIFENACFLSLSRFGPVQYYQKRSGGEIDFILPELGAAVEVKTRATRYDHSRVEKIAASIGIQKHFVVTKEYCAEPGCIPALDL